MKVSVVVPAYNEAKLIGETLCRIKASLAAFSEGGWQTELIVCDNNSTDRTAALARDAGATVVFEPINQIGRARNAGAAAATGDWLIFVDADSHPSRELFGDVARAIQSGGTLAGGCTVKLDTTHFGWNVFVQGWNWLSRLRKYAAGSFIFCETAAFRQMGGFNLNLFAGEEIDLSVRLKKAARQAGKRMVILHQHPLLTSGRKAQLYSVREYLRFLAATVLNFGRTVKDPKACFPWYDGRR